MLIEAVYGPDAAEVVNCVIGHSLLPPATDIVERASAETKVDGWDLLNE